MNRLTTWAQRLWRQVARSRKPATDTGVTHSSRFLDTLPWLSISNTRKDEENIIDRMDNEDGVVSTALDVIADCATTFIDPQEDRDFLIEGHSMAVETLGAMVTRTGLATQTWDIVRTMVKKGNHFLEPVLGEDKRIERIKQFPHSYQIHKNVDAYGNLKSGDPVDAFRRKIRGEAPYDQIVDNTLVACFYAWQIVHLAYGAFEGRTYAKACLLYTSPSPRDS